MPTSGLIWIATMDGMTMQLQWLVEIWVCHIQVHIHKDSAPLSTVATYSGNVQVTLHLVV